MINPYVLLLASLLTAVALYGIVLACTAKPPEGYQ